MFLFCHVAHLSRSDAFVPFPPLVDLDITSRSSAKVVLVACKSAALVSWRFSNKYFISLKVDVFGYAVALCIVIT